MIQAPIVFQSERISLETKILFANADKFASATTTSGAYSTSNVCLIAPHILFACRSDQKLKSSGSRSSFASKDACISGVRQDSGIRDGSESKQSGTMRIKLRRMESKLCSVGLSTYFKGVLSAGTNDRQMNPCVP